MFVFSLILCVIIGGKMLSIVISILLGGLLRSLKILNGLHHDGHTQFIDSSSLIRCEFRNIIVIICRGNIIWLKSSHAFSLEFIPFNFHLLLLLQELLDLLVLPRNLHILLLQFLFEFIYFLFYLFDLIF